ERGEGVEVADVRRDADRLAAHGAQRRLRILAGIGLAARDGDTGAGGDEALGERAPAAAGAAGDACNPSGQVAQGPELVSIHDGEPRTVIAPRFPSSCARS